MNDLVRAKWLRWTLRVLGLLFVFGVYPLTILWPSGWVWHVGQSHYLQMIIAIYATLGVFLLLASSHPEKHLSLLSFTIWSSIAHGGTMAVQALADSEHFLHLFGDVPALFIVAALLAWLSPEAFTLRYAKTSP